MKRVGVQAALQAGAGTLVWKLRSLMNKGRYVDAPSMLSSGNFIAPSRIERLNSSVSCVYKSGRYILYGSDYQ